MAKNQSKQKPTTNNVVAMLKKYQTAVISSAIASVVALCLGLLIGGTVGSSKIGGVTNLGATSFSSDKENLVIARYTYKGLQTISLKDMIDAGGMTQNDDGDYNMPSAENVISVIRMKILESEAKNSGVSITDEDVTQYVKDYLGMESIKDVAEAYGYGEDQLKTLLSETVLQNKFQEKIAGKRPEIPNAPTAPAEDADANEGTEEYAKLIQEIVGDEWDTKANDGKGGWTTKDSDYAKAAAEFDITNKSATYDAAAAVYQVAYNKYTADLTEFNQKINEYNNNLLKDVTITIATAVQ